MLAVVAGSQNAPPSFETLSRQADAARDAKQLEKAWHSTGSALKLKPGWEEGLWNRDPSPTISTAIPSALRPSASWRS